MAGNGYHRPKDVTGEHAGGTLVRVLDHAFGDKPHSLTYRVNRLITLLRGLRTMEADIFGINLKDFLALSVVGAIITTLGSFVALYLKEFIAVRSHERWKSEQALALIFDRYRRPLCSAARELSGRCYDFATNADWNEQNTTLNLLEKGETYTDRNAEEGDAYFRYKLLSNSYRLCCFLGWIELYRRDLGLIDTGSRDESRNLEKFIDYIRSDIADGQLNECDSLDEWKDVIIFREEQRAIAHRMISPDGSALIDFGTFCEIIDSNQAGQSSRRWLLLAVRFFADLGVDRDFRRTRMKRLNVHLNGLRTLLQPGSVRPDHIDGTAQLAAELGLLAEK